MGTTTIGRGTTAIKYTTDSKSGLITSIEVNDPAGLTNWPNLDIQKIDGLFTVDGALTTVATNGHSSTTQARKSVTTPRSKGQATAPVKAAPVKTAKAAPASAKAKATRNTSNYRKLTPEIKTDLIRALQMEQPTPTVRVLAERHDVPHHTMTGWLRTLKKHGELDKQD